MSKNPFTLISSEVKYQNPWISLREDTVIRPGGKEGVFGIVTMKDGATILAIDENHNVFITQEYHYAVADTTIELISGGIDEGESPLDCAKRELAEEAGIEADEWIDLGYIDPFSTIISSRNYIFLARKLRRIRENPDEGEIVNLGAIPYAELLQKVMNSEVSHGASVVAVLKAKDYIL